MNVPPETFVRVQTEPLRTWVRTVFEKLELPPEHARLLAEWLVANDRRGVFSHGTQRMVQYVHQYRNKELNPRPQIRVLNETPTTAIIDGDGGLGYFPSYEAAKLVAKKAKEQGVANVITRNHGHFGAAGLWSRVIVAQDLLAYVTSGHQLDLKPGQPHRHEAGGSPMSFAAPAGEEPPIVLDFGAIHDMYDSDPHVKALELLAPGTVFRSIGLGSFCQILGGFLCGVPVEPERAKRQWVGANQGAFLTAYDITRYLALADFKREVDSYIRKVRQLKPIQPRFEAEVAGGMEHKREQEWTKEGIPIGEEHAKALREISETTGIPLPF